MIWEEILSWTKIKRYIRHKTELPGRVGGIHKINTTMDFLAVTELYPEDIRMELFLDERIKKQHKRIIYKELYGEFSYELDVLTNCIDNIRYHSGSGEAAYVRLNSIFDSTYESLMKLKQLIKYD